jgi:hypothetical protein
MLSDNILKWRTIFEEWPHLRILTLNESNHRWRVLKEFGFPVFDRHCDRQLGAYQVALTLTDPIAYHEDLNFFGSVHWQVLANWTTTPVDLGPSFEILRSSPNSPDVHSAM